MASPKSPGRAHREGVSLIDLFEMFPDEDTATQWFEAALWNGNRCCGHCGSMNTREAPNRKPMPYWCSDCRSYFSARTGTAIASSKVPLRKWAIAIYLCLTSLKSVSSMKLHRDLDVSQKTAWFMLHRIREAWAAEAGDGTFAGPVEADETFVGGKSKNMHAKVRRSRGAPKSIVAGVRDRRTRKVKASVVPRVDSRTLCRFVESAAPGAFVYTDDNNAYTDLDRRAVVRHSAGEYVKGQASINGLESFWSMLKRAYAGTFHKLSPKHLNRYVQEFAGKHNVRDLDTLAQMRLLVARLVGQRLLYRDLIADNGLPSGARGAPQRS